MDNMFWTEENIDDSIGTSINQNSFLHKNISTNERGDDLLHSSGIIENFELMPDLLDGKMIPDLTMMQPWPATEAVADLLGIVDDETNLKSFWIVDTLAYSLKQMQEKGMHQLNQKAFIYWFFYILENINVHNWSREKTFSTLKVMFLRAEKLIISESDQIPTPKVCSESYPKKSSVMEENGSNQDEKDERSEISKERNLSELDNLIDLIYSIFANQFKYEVIRTTFANITRWDSIEILDAINSPRTLQVDPIEKTVRKEKEKRRKSSVPTDIAESGKEHILPLIKSVDQTFFDQLFPVVSSAKNKTKKNEKSAKKR